MILLKTEIKHSGPLGLDDFPTNLTVTCEFDRGKPRDQYGVEAMYMNGNDRIYHGMSDKILDAYKAAQIYKNGTTPTDANGGTNASWIDYDEPGTKQFVAPKSETSTQKPNSATAKTEQGQADNSKGKNSEQPENKKESQENQPGKDDDKGKDNKDAETAAGSQVGAPAPEIHIPGQSLDDLKARFAENEALAAQALIKMGNNPIIREVFGDPDAYVILYTSKEQQEGSASQQTKEDPASANTGGNNTAEESAI